MPIYVSTKQNFTIPQYSDSELSDNDMYLNDPDMIYDRLPQPFHFINKIINGILNDAWTSINIIEKRKLANLSKSSVKNIFNVSISEKLDSIQYICEISPDSNYLVAGLKNGLGIIDIVSGTFIDRWENEEIDVISLHCKVLTDNMYIVAVMENSGSGRLVALTNNRLYNLKTFQANKETDKPSQVTSLFLEDNCAFVAVSFDQFKENEQWLEIHKINREVLIKEIENIDKTFQDQMSEIQVVNEEASGDESSSLYNRNRIKSNSTTIILKLKYPNSFGAVGFNSLNQLHKQIDTSGSIIGIGFNHCLSTDYMEKMNNTIHRDSIDLENYLSSINSDTHLLRIANVRFFKHMGAMISSDSSHEGSDRQSLSIFVWWSQSQHLLIYGLNKLSQSTNENLIKPDAVRTFSCPIIACELSFNKLFLAIGLENGIFVLLDVISGLTKLTKQISDCAIQSLYSLNFANSSQTIELESLQTSMKTLLSNDRNKAYFSIVDIKNRMYCLKFDSLSYCNESSYVMVSEDHDADYIGRISPGNDMALFIFYSNIIIIRDLVSGLNLLRVQLPNDTFLSSPWQPIFGYLCATGQFCLQVVQNEQSEDLEKRKTLTVIYDLGIQNDDHNTSERKGSNEALPSDNAYIISKIYESLQHRYIHHERRQEKLRECWNNLDEIIKSLS